MHVEKEPLYYFIRHAHFMRSVHFPSYMEADLSVTFFFLTLFLYINTVIKGPFMLDCQVSQSNGVVLLGFSCF